MPKNEADHNHGALVVQEDPLSGQGDWNVHLNAILLTEGAFDFDEARKMWGANLELRPLKPENLLKTCLELVKYSAQAVSTKSQEKQATGITLAPGMIDWAPEAFLEWWQAQKGFRRTRSYGCLYKIECELWNKAPISDRIQYLSWSTLRKECVNKDWCELSEAERRNLRLAIRRGEPLDLEAVSWLGQVTFREDHYIVDLIPEDKSKPEKSSKLLPRTSKECFYSYRSMPRGSPTMPNGLSAIGPELT